MASSASALQPKKKKKRTGRKRKPQRNPLKIVWFRFRQRLSRTLGLRLLKGESKSKERIHSEEDSTDPNAPSSPKHPNQNHSDHGTDHNARHSDLIHATFHDAGRDWLCPRVWERIRESEDPRIQRLVEKAHAWIIEQTRGRDQIEQNGSLLGDGSVVWAFASQPIGPRFNSDRPLYCVSCEMFLSTSGLVETS
jgi:hypothetical protein